MAHYYYNPDLVQYINDTLTEARYEQILQFPFIPLDDAEDEIVATEFINEYYDLAKEIEKQLY